MSPLHRVAIFVLVTALLIFQDNLVASELTALEDFRKGVREFENKAYQSALEYFLRAQTRGMEDYRLHYNIGVTYYKLGYYPQAIDALSKATGDPLLASSAHLNAGLSALKLNDQRKQVSQFKLAYRTAITKKQKYLAQVALNNHYQQQMKSKSSKWRVTLQSKVGINDNVKQDTTATLVDGGVENVPSANFTINNQARWDRYVVNQADVNYIPLRNSRFSLSGLSYNYDKYTDYDFSRFALGFTHYLRWPVFTAKAQANFSSSFFGGQRFQEISSFSLSSIKKFSDSYFEIFYRGSNISTAENFVHLHGLSRHLETRLWRNVGRDQFVGLSYVYETNDRHDRYNTGQLYSSYSPAIHKLAFFAKFFVRKHVELEFFTDVGQLDYPQIDRTLMIETGSAEGAPSEVSLPIKRDDTRRRVILQARYSLLKSTNLSLEYQRVQNSSSDDVFSYSSDRYSLGIVMRF